MKKPPAEKRKSVDVFPCGHANRFGKDRCYKMHREKGTCPECGRNLTINTGVGPDRYGKGDVRQHKKPKIDEWCPGGRAVEIGFAEENND